MEFNALLWRGLVMGCGATLVFDLWALLLHRVLATPLPNWALVGRWFCHLWRGRLVHQDIAATAPVAGERVWGWAFHYGVGVSFALATLILGGAAWARAPTWPLPMAVGWATVLCGWLLLQPGMGAGIAARLKPNAWQIRAMNLAAHTVFGLALYALARALA